MARRSRGPITFDYNCPTEGCDAELEFEIEPECSGSYDEPPSGGTAYPTEDCPSCKTDHADNEAFLEKVYAAWCDSCEPDFD